LLYSHLFRFLCASSKTRAIENDAIFASRISEVKSWKDLLEVGYKVDVSF